jgi:hypothetical protein
MVRDNSTVIFLRHTGNYPPKFFRQQPENGLPLAQGPAQILGGQTIAHFFKRESALLAN